MRRSFVLLTALLLCGLLCFGALADEGSVVFDRADLLTAEELNELDRLALEFAEEHDFQLVLVTETGNGGVYIGDYADDLYDNGGFLPDGILFIIDMELREWYVSTAGRGISAFSDYVIDSMTEDVLYYLSEGYYYDAFLEFINQCGSCLDSYDSGAYIPEEDDYYSYPYEDDYGDYPYYDDGYVERGRSAPGPLWILISVGAGLISALIATGSMKGKMNSVSFKRNASGYEKRGSLVLSEQRDVFLYHTLSRVPRPKNDDINRGGHGGGSFGGGVHMSGGGVSHGGHGGRF